MTIQEQWKGQGYKMERHQKIREVGPKNRCVDILVRILK